MKRLWSMTMLSLVVTSATAWSARGYDEPKKNDDLPVVTPQSRETDANREKTKDADPVPPIVPQTNNATDADRDDVAPRDARRPDQGPPARDGRPGDRPPEGRRPDGDRGPEGRRDGDARRPEAGPPHGRGRPDQGPPPRDGRPGDRPPEGRRPDGDRGPEGRRDGDARRPEAGPPHGRGRPDQGPPPRDGAQFSAPFGRFNGQPPFAGAPLSRGPFGGTSGGGRMPPFGPMANGPLGGYPPFNEIDANNDGKLSREEVLKHFDKSDKNHDGEITREEMLSNLRERMSQPRRPDSQPKPENPGRDRERPDA